MVLGLVRIISLVLSLITIIYIAWRSKTKQFMAQKERLLANAPHLGRGVIGYFSIALGLLLLQPFIVGVGRAVTRNIFPEYFLFITIFYLIAFTLPFLLTISTEFAQD